MWIASLRNWAEMIQFSHTVFALPFALASMVVASAPEKGWPGWRLFSLIGMIFAELLLAPLQARKEMRRNEYWIALDDHMDCLERTPLDLIPDLPDSERPNPIDAIPPALPGQPPAPWTNPYDDPPNEGEQGGFDPPGTGTPSDDDYYYTLGSLIHVKLIVCQLILSIELGAIADALAVDLSICDAHRDRQLESAERERDFQLDKLKKRVDSQ